jgi:hypothetical protein
MHRMVDTGAAAHFLTKTALRSMLQIWTAQLCPRVGPTPIRENSNRECHPSCPMSQPSISVLWRLSLPLSETVIFTTRTRASRVSSVFNCFKSHRRIATPIIALPL